MARRKKTWADYMKEQARRIWSWDGERKKAKERAKVGTDNRGNHLFRCEKCGLRPLVREGVQVDHVEEVDNPQGWDGWDAWLTRLFVAAAGLQVLCLKCHKEKTVANNAIRRARRRKPNGSDNSIS